MKSQSLHSLEHASIPAAIQATLGTLRARRRFEAAAWTQAKLLAMEDYFQQNGITAAVIGVSGGIDSALVLGLLARLKAQGTLQRVVPVLLPYLDNRGATAQDDATARGQEVCAAFGLEPHVFEMSPVSRAHQELVAPKLSPWSDWAIGQAVAYFRTPMLYATTSWLSDQGLRPVVVGTTNRDEGAYLGYVGKAADGMVDVQPIADLHKSEVRAVARLLGVPQSILDVAPSGDMFDGRIDEEVFGAPYDIVELALLWKSMLSAPEQAALRAAWSLQDAALFDGWMENIEALHRYNAHKYNVGSPAVHLDVLPSAVPGGWEPAPQVFRAPPSSVVSSLFVPVPSPRPDWVALPTLAPEVRAGVQHLGGVLSPQGVDAIRAMLRSQAFVDADTRGQWKSFDPALAVGSRRATFFSQELAEWMWEKIAQVLPPFRVWPEGEASAGTDVGPYRVWRPVMVAPLFRVIDYPTAGYLEPHYDAPFEWSPRRKTLSSLVLSLTDNSEARGGRTLFWDDHQAGAPFSARDFSDDAAARTHHGAPVHFNLAAGDALIFDHRLVHGAEATAAGKTIIRTDVVWEAVGARVRA